MLMTLYCSPAGGLGGTDDDNNDNNKSRKTQEAIIVGHVNKWYKACQQQVTSDHVFPAFPGDSVLGNKYVGAGGGGSSVCLRYCRLGRDLTTSGCQGSVGEHPMWSVCGHRSNSLPVT